MQKNSFLDRAFSYGLFSFKEGEILWLRLVYNEQYGKEGVGLRTFCTSRSDLEDKLSRHGIGLNSITFLSVNDKEVEPSEIHHLFERS